VSREPIWVPRLVVEAVHLDQVRTHGGLAGLRDDHALEAALARPQQRWHCEPTADLPARAASYGYGLCQNHPFRDGNKRLAFVTMVVFLRLNGLKLDAPEPEVVTAMVAVASGKSTEAELADWLRARSSKSRWRRKAT
jgi:death-on-curing protein